MRLRALLAIFIVAGSASAQDLIGGSSGGATGGGGGAPTDATYWLGSANGSLSAEIVVNDIASLEAAISAYDFNDAANLTTGDIAAARMATNWGVAGTSACATSGGVMFDNATAVGCAAEFTFDGTLMSVRDFEVPGGAGFGKNLRITSNTYGSTILFDNAAGAAIGYSNGNDEFKLILTGNSGLQFVVGANTLGAGMTDDFGHPTQTNPTLFIHSATRPTVASDEWVSFTHDGTNALFGIGSGAFVFQDPTATIGDTLLKVLSGAGESGNCQEWDDDGTGALASVDCETGNSVFSNVTLGTTGATFYGPSASEPIDCTTSNDGSMYFDTDDQKLCICANDGTDDEWLHSDNYGHGSGHCSI